MLKLGVGHPQGLFYLIIYNESYLSNFAKPRDRIYITKARENFLEI